MSRYKVVGSAAECEPGSNGLVLRNHLGITDPAVMEVVGTGPASRSLSNDHREWGSAQPPERFRHDRLASAMAGVYLFLGRKGTNVQSQQTRLCFRKCSSFARSAQVFRIGASGSADCWLM